MRPDRTVQLAIDESIRTDSTITVPAECESDLQYECDEQCDGAGGTYWGSRRGQPWAVQVQQ
jgi:hypothetical protein